MKFAETRNMLYLYSQVRVIPDSVNLVPLCPVSETGSVLAGSDAVLGDTVAMSHGHLAEVSLAKSPI
jgi:hypothetical protein